MEEGEGKAVVLDFGILGLGRGIREGEKRVNRVKCLPVDSKSEASSNLRLTITS